MKRPDLTKVFTAAVVILIIAVIGGAFVIQNSQYNSLLGLYAKQQRQLLSNGITPSGPSAAQLTKTGATGPSGPIGANGPRGDTGQQGASGAPGPSGSAGSNGLNGAAGPSGSAGPAGPAGATGPAGPAGADGEPGAPGAAGVDGAPPLSWTYVTPLGVMKRCDRDVPFDPKAPTYHCVVASTPSPTPTP
jgi:hypothetical protein